MAMRLLLARCFITILALCGAAFSHAADADLAPNAQLLALARAGDVEGVRKVLAQGASPDARNRLGETALLIAAKRDDAPLVRVMLEAGTGVNIAAVNGVTALMA